MTGPEHYRLAEECLERAGGNDPASLQATWSGEALVAAAQVHATLALSAATAMRWVLPDDVHAWRQAVGAAPQPSGGPS